MGLFRRRRTWRTLLAIPLGLALGWLAAGYATDFTHAEPPASSAASTPGDPDAASQPTDDSLAPGSRHEDDARE